MVRLLIIFCMTLCVSNSYSQQSKVQEMGWPFDSTPVFRGDIRLFIQKNVIYPESAIRDSLEGKVFVTYVVDKLGFTKNHSIEKSVRPDLDKEAIRVTKLIKYDRPAMYKGKPVLFTYTVPVVFKLKKYDTKSYHK